MTKKTLIVLVSVVVIVLCFSALLGIRELNHAKTGQSETSQNSSSIAVSGDLWQCSATGQIISFLSPYLKNEIGVIPDQENRQSNVLNFGIYWKQRKDEPFLNISSDDSLDKSSSEFPPSSVGTYDPETTLATISQRHGTIKKALLTQILPTLNKAGIRLAYEEETKHPDPSGVVTSYYLLQKGLELYNINISSMMGHEQSIKATVRCANSTPQRMQQLANLRAVAPYANWTNKEVISVAEQTDNVLHIAVNQISNPGGFSQWWTSIDKRWVKLFEGQTAPPCEIFEKIHVGTSLRCARCKPDAETCDDSYVQ